MLSTRAGGKALALLVFFIPPLADPRRLPKSGHEIIDALSTYKRGYTLEETSRRMSSRHGTVPRLLLPSRPLTHLSGMASNLLVMR
jgi:hypothetical protein